MRSLALLQSREKVLTVKYRPVLPAMCISLTVQVEMIHCPLGGSASTFGSLKDGWVPRSVEIPSM